MALVNHPSRVLVPDIRQVMIRDTDGEGAQFGIQPSQFVGQLPEHFRPFGSRQHIVRATLGHRHLQQAISLDELRRCFEVEVVHGQCGTDTHRISIDGPLYLIEMLQGLNTVGI